MTNRRKGWVRIGIVASVLWLASSSVIVVIDLRTTSDRLTHDIFQMRYNKGEWEIDHWRSGGYGGYFKCSMTDKEPESDDYSIEFIKSKMDCKPLVYPFAILYLTPLLVIWLLVPISIRIILWVMDGFRDHVSR